jgi:hypothetical protein
LEYRQDENGRPVKQNDHTCDAVRYLVTTYKLKGLVYVYRELYRPQSLTEGFTYLDEIAEIHALSGWERAPIQWGNMYQPGPHAEHFERKAVADRSMGKLIATFNRDFGIPCRPAVRLKAPSQRKQGDAIKPFFEVIEGIKQVQALMSGTQDLEAVYDIRRPGDIVLRQWDEPFGWREAGILDLGSPELKAALRRRWSKRRP